MSKQIEDMAKVMHDRSHEIAEDPYRLAKILARGKNMADDFAEVLYKEGYRKTADVIAKVLEILSELKENYLADDDAREACAISYAEIKLVALKKKYESERVE